jgi:hypothetical protein
MSASVILDEPAIAGALPACDGELPTSGSAPAVSSEAGMLPAFPVPWRHPIRCLAWLMRATFGLASLVFMLSLLAAVPIVNFLTLGYLLEVEGRVARSGKLRDGFPLFKLAPRIGAIGLGVWLWLLPLRLLAGAAGDAQIIEPGSATANTLSIVLNVAWFLVTLHLCLALARGGSLGCFVRPLKNLLWLIRRLRDGDYMQTASRHVSEFVGRLRLKEHFLLGIKGFLGAFAWLLVPSLLYFAPSKQEGLPVLITILGGITLAIVHAWVPFLQARLTAENRLSAAFELRKVRDLYRYAPLTWGITILLVYALALPLYLFKAFLLPPDALWTVAVLFIVTIYPTKLLLGWAYHRATSRKAEDKRAAWWLRWLVRLGLITPAIAAYVFILYFTQFLGEAGKQELLRHHAFLLPLQVG